MFKKNGFKDEDRREKKVRKTERPRMLVHILSRAGGTKRIYIYIRVNLGSSEEWRRQ